MTTSVASQWSDLLQAITVTTTNDVVDGNTSSIAALLASRGNDGFISLREAIIATNGSVGADVIFLGSGTYTLSIAGNNENNSATGDLDIRDDLEIWGTGSGSTTIEGAGIDRVFCLRDTAQVTINDLTIRGGDIGAGDGGGIYVLADANSLTLQGVVVSNNAAGKGAGIFVREGTLEVYDSTISNNTSSVSGGGLFNDQGRVSLNSSAILQNTATTSGGGIHNGGSGANLSLMNVTVSGNISSGQGGGIYNKRTATIVHSTIAFNSAASGGGIYFDNSGTLSIRNSILAINTGGNANTTVTGSLGHNLSDNSSSGLTHASDLIVADPKLGAIGNYGGASKTIAILTGSAAIDAGDATGVSQFDQRGFTRDTSTDIGAFEYQRLATTGELSINATNGSIQETSASTQGSQRAVAIASSGEYVVVWTSTGQDGAATGIYARRFDHTGAFVGNEFRINTTTAGVQSDASVAMNGSGQFIVVWQGNGNGDADGIFFRRFDAAGVAIDASERLANGSNLGVELAPSVAFNDAGQFAIGWHVGNDLYIRHFAANGTTVFSDTQVDTPLANALGSSIGIDSNGRTVIVYRTDGVSGVGSGVWGRGFNADGSQLYLWFLIASGDATSPSIDMNADGSFIVVWNASDRTFDGQIDELQISSTIRSSDWVTQQYRTIFSASTTSASVQSRPTGLLLNDTDSDIDPLTVSLVSGPAHALSFTLNTDGSFTYQHNGDFVATDSFTYQLSDGQGGVSTATANFAIQWTNTPPTISAIADRTVAEDTASGSIAFTIGDLETSTNALAITVSSSNQSLITNAGIVLGGTGANRTFSFTPQSNATGTAVITVIVDDGSLTAIETFNVIVNPVDDAPTISFIAAQSINEDTSSGVITFTIGDADNALSSLIVTAASNRQSLIANSSITLGGSGANRTISFTPQSDENGSAVVQITVDDGTRTTTRNVIVTVDAVNDAPIAVSDSLTAEQSAPTIIRRSALLANDIEQDGDSLIIEVVG